MSEPLFRAGHVFKGPEGEGYLLLRDALPGELIRAVDLKPIGGAPKPEPNQLMPVWLPPSLQPGVGK